MSNTIFLLSVLHISVVLGSASAILAWREGQSPGARPLVLLLAGQVFWSLMLIFRLRAPGVEAKLFWMYLMWIGVVAIPLGWMLFALSYTGHDRFLNWRYVSALAVVPVVTVILSILGPAQELLQISIAQTPDLSVAQNDSGGIWYWIVAAYTYLLGGVGSALLVRLALSQMAAFRKQAYTLIGALIIPWGINLCYLTNVLSTPIDPTPVAFSVSGVIYLTAIRRYSLLRTNPAPNTTARRLVFDSTQEGILVLDLNDNVINVNGPALEMLNVQRDELLGSSAPETIPKYEAFPDSGVFEDFLTIQTHSGKRDFKIKTVEITTQRGQVIGSMVTLQDVTEFLRQEQRLQVLNRVLRHNIKTETNLILGYSEDLPTEAAERVKQSALQIDELGQKGREAIRLFSRAREESDVRSIEMILKERLREVRSRFSDVTFELQCPDQDVPVDVLVSPVLSNAIENAAEHNTSDSPHVEIVASVGEQVQIEIRDNGPGIPEHELSVLSEGTESVLHHGSGLGLWIIKWGTDLLGGRVQFGENEVTGTVVSISLPRKEPSAN
ncbi:histidine kinase N-terminal 7TM domain-containing protein [Halorubrum sp. C191]|uniref:histidine kinase N-terminal 7TM domain-containing protein n=1 Tax=Halorubrum sp. C191 TaxID=1383842 RepID=UPI002AA29B82|nr:histidine kinase N-terminal 7TM domain-containing protein [Halorubrum sp. C191]